MNIYEQNNFPLTKHKLEFLSDDTLGYEYRSINKKTINLIPLAYLYPKEELVKHSSKKAGYFLLLILTLIFISPITYIHNLVDWGNIWDFNTVWFFLFVLAGIFGKFYNWNSHRESLVLYYKNGSPALKLPYDKKIITFKDEIIKKAIHASCLEDVKNIEFLKNKISQLSADKIINSEFEEELHGRLMSLSLPT